MATVDTVRDLEREWEEWHTVVDKMITAYKAPISPDDAKAIVDYLIRTKGNS